MQVRFKREWRKFTIGSETDLASGVAEGLIRRGYAEPVPETVRKHKPEAGNKSRSARKG